MPHRAFLVAALLALLASLPARGDETRIFGDWTASCWTRSASCAAETDAVPGAGSDRYGLTFSIARRNGKGADWRVGLRIRAAATGAETAYLVTIDDRDEFRFVGDKGVSGAGRSVRFGPAGAAIDLLRALREGRRAVVAVGGERGKSEALFSLQGLSGALGWINAAQGRSDDPSLTPAPATETAEPEPATPEPTAETPAPPETKTKKAGDLPPALLAHHGSKSDCAPPGSGALAGHKPTSAALPDGKTLFIVPCFAGTSRLASRLYLMRDNDPATVRTLYFANYSKSLGWYGSDTLIGAAYDAKAGVLTSRGDGGGKGGCGNAARYAWDGIDFRMVEYRAWDRCDGIRTPEQWPIVYKTPE